MPTFPRCASSFALVLALVASRGAGAASATSGEAHPGQRAFAIEVARQAARPGLDAAAIEAVLAQARYQQSIIDAISRPAEKTKPWRDYRPIFLTPQRAEQGLAFWRENAALLDRVSAEFGVPPEIIVAIIGVEQQHGHTRHDLGDGAFGAGHFFDDLGQLGSRHAFDGGLVVGQHRSQFGIGALDRELDFGRLAALFGLLRLQVIGRLDGADGLDRGLDEAHIALC